MKKKKEKKVKKEITPLMVVLCTFLGSGLVMAIGGIYLVVNFAYQIKKPITTYKKDTFTKEEEAATRYVLGITNNEKYQISTSTCAARGTERLKAYIHTDEENLSIIMKELYGYSEEYAQDIAHRIESDFGRVPNIHGYTEPYTNMLGEEVQTTMILHDKNIKLYGIEYYIWEEGKGYGIEIVAGDSSEHSLKIPDVWEMYQETGEEIEEDYNFFIFLKKVCKQEKKYED